MHIHPHTSALKCTLPPTCAGRGKECYFENVVEMERHHATYHTHACLEGGCGKVFPDARFLNLVSLLLCQLNIISAKLTVLVYY